MASGLVELGTMAQTVDKKKLVEIGLDRQIIGLALLVSAYLGKPLRKDMAITDWSCPVLTAEQKLCIISRMQAVTVDAANDCYATWKVFQVLETLRQETPSIEMPDLIDYFDCWKESKLKMVRTLLFNVRRHGQTVEMELCSLISARSSPKQRDKLQEDLYRRYTSDRQRRQIAQIM